jgi:hypothetical protein
VGGAEAADVPGVEPGDGPIDWAEDGRTLFIAPGGDGGPSLKVFRLDTRTGARTFWREIRPPDPVGVVGIDGLRVTPDGRAYVYNIRRVISNLYVVEGLE